MAAGRVLIVDDSSTVRLKIGKAVEALGHSATAVSTGAAALDILKDTAIDVVLLDIVMPGMDGFEVLKSLKSTRQTKDIPVIVISGLDDEMSSVVKAIELGSEDFLPKNFEPALLQARLSACIEKKRLRDVEREYLMRVGKLTRAAVVLESGRFDPSKLGLQDIATKSDGLGKLASVFSAMALKVYERERRLRQSLRTFQGVLLLIACGALLGLIVPLSKMVANITPNPIGLTILTSVVGAVVAIGFSLYRRKFPKLSLLTRSDWTYIVVWALLSVVINRVLISVMAGVLPAFIVAIVIVLEGFVVFLFAAIMRIESPKVKRFVGLGLGLAGVLVISLYGTAADASDHWGWIFIALVIPVTYAAEDIYIAQKKPAHLDPTALFGIICVISILVLIPPAFIIDGFIPMNLLAGKAGVLILLIGVSSALAMICFVYLVSSTGAVFASQSAYAVTASGIGWSVLLLGEHIPVATWAALALIIIGLILVEPKQEAEEEPPQILEDIEDIPVSTPPG